MLADIEAKDREPAGDWAAEGSSEYREDAGEEGGATNGSTTLLEGAWVGFSAEVGSALKDVGSGLMLACPIRLFCL